VGGIATISLIVNGVTANPLLKILKLTDNPTLDKEVYAGHIKKQLRQRMNSVIKEMSKDISPHHLEMIQRLYTRPSRSRYSDTSSNADDSRTSDNSNNRNRPPTPSAASPPRQYQNVINYFRKLQPSRGKMNEANLRALQEEQNNIDRKSSFSLASQGSSLSSFLAGSNGSSLYAETFGINDVLAYMRGTFLEIVRVHYWS
jgi:hypothetical protein